MDWQPISTAPTNATEIRVKMRDGTIHEKAHWAEDLSGSDQPPFKGWFVPHSENGFDGIQEPEFWMPVPNRIHRGAIRSMK